MGTSRPLIPCTEETRALVRACKRGGESYDSLLRKMVEQYEPEDVASDPYDGENP